MPLDGGIYHAMLLQFFLIISSILGVFLLNGTSFPIRKKLYDIDLKNVICSDVDTYLCKNSVCEVLPSNSLNSKRKLNLYCNVPQPTDNFWLRIIVYFKFNSNYRKFFLDEDIDLCAYMTGKQQSAGFDRIKNIMNYHNQMVHHCPYYGLEGLRNFTFDSAMMPTMLPAGNYLIYLRFSTISTGQNRTLLTAKVFTYVYATPITDLAMF